jgi:transketolase
MVGMAAGLANGGKIPFVCGASCFLTGRALEQIKADLAYSFANVKLCGMSSGIAYGELGPPTILLRIWPGRARLRI